MAAAGPSVARAPRRTGSRPLAHEEGKIPRPIYERAAGVVLAGPRLAEGSPRVEAAPIDAIDPQAKEVTDTAITGRAGAPGRPNVLKEPADIDAHRRRAYAADTGPRGRGGPRALIERPPNGVGEAGDGVATLGRPACAARRYPTPHPTGAPPVAIDRAPAPLGVAPAPPAEGSGGVPALRPDEAYLRPRALVG